MTIDDAADAVGNKVVYRPGHGPVEEGVITSTNSRFVFVRFGADAHSKATPPELLELLTLKPHRED